MKKQTEWKYPDVVDKASPPTPPMPHQHQFPANDCLVQWLVLCNRLSGHRADVLLFIKGKLKKFDWHSQYTTDCAVHRLACSLLTQTVSDLQSIQCLITHWYWYWHWLLVLLAPSGVKEIQENLQEKSYKRTKPFCKIGTRWQQVLGGSKCHQQLQWSH